MCLILVTTSCNIFVISYIIISYFMLVLNREISKGLIWFVIFSLVGWRWYKGNFTFSRWFMNSLISINLVFWIWIDVEVFRGSATMVNDWCLMFFQGVMILRGLCLLPVLLICAPALPQGKTTTKCDFLIILTTHAFIDAVIKLY